MQMLIEKMIEYYTGDPKRIQHFLKVHAFAKLIGELEQVDEVTQFYLESAALVHDIGIRKAEEQYGRCDGKYQEELGPAEAEKMLRELEYCPQDIERICYLVGHHHTYTDIEGMDYQILVEADFLVNLYEDHLGQKEVERALEHIFRTPSGIWLCNVMFGLSD